MTQVAVLAVVLSCLLAAGCTTGKDIQPDQPVVLTPPVAASDVPEATAPTVPAAGARPAQTGGPAATAPAAKPAVAVPTPPPVPPRASSTPATAPGTAGTPAPPATMPAQPARPAATTPPPVQAPPAKVATAPAAPGPTPRPAPVTAAPKPTAPPLDLAGLETRLRDTKAIGVFTKLSLKNQVDDLLAKFRAYHKRQATVALTDLRRPYDMLLLKVLSLLQDSDPPLARDIVASREAIWSILADERKFNEAQLMAGDVR